MQELTFCKGFEDLLDVGSCSGTCTEVLDTQLLCVVLRILKFYLPVTLQVTLVSNNLYRKWWTTLLSELLDPHAHFGEGVYIGDIIHDQGSLSSSVVDGVQGVMLLLSSSVPDGQLIHLRLHALGVLRVLYSHCLLQTSCVNGTLLGIAKLVYAETNRNGCLSYSGYTSEKQGVRHMDMQESKA